MPERVSRRSRAHLTERLEADRRMKGGSSASGSGPSTRSKRRGAMLSLLVLLRLSSTCLPSHLRHLWANCELLSPLLVHSLVPASVSHARRGLFACSTPPVGSSTCTARPRQDMDIEQNSPSSPSCVTGLPLDHLSVNPPLVVTSSARLPFSPSSPQEHARPFPPSFGLHHLLHLVSDAHSDLVTTCDLLNL